MSTDSLQHPLSHFQKSASHRGLGDLSLCTGTQRSTVLLLGRVALPTPALTLRRLQVCGPLPSPPCAPNNSGIATARLPAAARTWKSSPSSHRPASASIHQRCREGMHPDNLQAAPSQMLPWESPPSSSSLGSGLRRASIQSLDDRPWGWASVGVCVPKHPRHQSALSTVSPHHAGCQHQCHHLLKSIQAILRAGLRGRVKPTCSPPYPPGVNPDSGLATER